MSSNQDSLAKQQASIVKMTEEVKKLEQQIKRTAAVAIRESEKAGKSQIRIIQQIHREQQRTAEARLRKELRAEQQIQREIIKSGNAYKNFAATASAAQKQIQNASKASRNSIRELNKELEKSSKIQKNSGVSKNSGWNTAKSAGSAIIKGGKALYDAVSPSIDDEKKLRSGVLQTAAKAYVSDKSKSTEWIKTEGVKEIQSLVKGLVASNGGTSQAALDLINDMLQQNMTLDQVKATIPYAHRSMINSSTEVGKYDHENTAKLFKSFADYGLKNQDYHQVSDHIIDSTKQGKFSIAELSDELPELLSSGKKAGLTDIRGIDYLISSLQATSTHSDSKEDAGKSVKALLGALADPSFTEKLSRVKDPNSPNRHLDWNKIREEGGKQGLNDVQSLLKVCTEILAKDKNYQNLKQKADSGDLYSSQLMQARQDKLLSFIPEEAKDAVHANLSNQNLLQPQTKLFTQSGESSSDRHAAVLAANPEFQQEKNHALTTLGRSEAVEPLVGFQTKLTELSAEFPVLTLAVTALAAAAGSAATALQTLGSLSGSGQKNGIEIDGGDDFDKKRNKNSKNKGSKTPSSSKTTLKSRKFPAKMAGKVMGRGNLALSAIGGVANGIAIANDESLTAEQKKTAQIKNASSTTGSMAGAWAGGEIGAAIGTFIFPGVGTVLGGLVGGLIGGIGGSMLGDKIGDKVTQTNENENIHTAADTFSGQRMSSDWHDAYGVNPALSSQFKLTSDREQMLNGNYMMTSTAMMMSYKNIPANMHADENQLPAGQSVLVQQNEQFQNAFQSIVLELGIRLDKIATILSSQQQVIQNNVTLTLDGRVISNIVSRNQVEMYNRGGAQ